MWDCPQQGCRAVLIPSGPNVFPPWVFEESRVCTIAHCGESSALGTLPSRALRKNPPEPLIRYSMLASCATIASIGAFAHANIGVSRCV